MPDVITGLELGRQRLNGAALCMSSPICGQRRGKNEDEDGQECELLFHQDCVFRNTRRVFTRKWRYTSSLWQAAFPDAHREPLSLATFASSNASFSTAERGRRLVRQAPARATI